MFSSVFIKFIQLRGTRRRPDIKVRELPLRRDMMRELNRQKKQQTKEVSMKGALRI